MIPADATHLAGREVAEVAGDGRRTDVDRDAVRGVDEAGPHRVHPVPAVHRDRHRARAARQRGLQRGEDAGPQVEAGEVPLLGERVEQPAPLAAVGAEIGRRERRRGRGARRDRSRDRRARPSCARRAGAPGSRRARRSTHVGQDARRAPEPARRVERAPAAVRALGAARSRRDARARSRSRAWGTRRTRASPCTGRRAPARCRPSRGRRRAGAPRRARSCRPAPRPRRPLGVNTTVASLRAAVIARGSDASGSQPPLATNRCSRSRGNASSSRCASCSAAASIASPSAGSRATVRRHSPTYSLAVFLPATIAASSIARLEPAGQHHLVLLGARTARSPARGCRARR